MTIAGLPQDISRPLLAWYDAQALTLPWRGSRDPYRIWLSEIMLQQTRIAAVEPYYARFLDRFPSVQALAAAPLDEVLKAWEGLGYYARARNLHRLAQTLSNEHQGQFPSTAEALQELPGIGRYTAAAGSSTGSGNTCLGSTTTWASHSALSWGRSCARSCTYIGSSLSTGQPCILLLSRHHF